MRSVGVVSHEYQHIATDDIGTMYFGTLASRNNADNLTAMYWRYIYIYSLHLYLDRWRFLERLRRVSHIWKKTCTLDEQGMMIYSYIVHLPSSAPLKFCRVISVGGDLFPPLKVLASTLHVGVGPVDVDVEIRFASITSRPFGSKKTARKGHGRSSQISYHSHHKCRVSNIPTEVRFLAVEKCGHHCTQTLSRFYP